MTALVLVRVTRGMDLTKVSEILKSNPTDMGAHASSMGLLEAGNTIYHLRAQQDTLCLFVKILAAVFLTRPDWFSSHRTGFRRARVHRGLYKNMLQLKCPTSTAVSLVSVEQSSMEFSHRGERLVYKYVCEN